MLRRAWIEASLVHPVIRDGLRLCVLGGVASACLGLTIASAQIAGPVPKELDEVEVVEHLDEPLPLDLRFTDQSGKDVVLGDFFDGERPVLLTINYYGCPMLCGLQLNGLVSTLKELEWTAGDQFDIVTVSINPLETPTLAKLKQQGYIKEYGRPEAAAGWSFLTGSQSNIDALTAATGFGYEFIEKTGEYSHAAVAFVSTPDGVLSRYLYGVVFDPKTVKLSLVEAAEGKIGSPLDQILLWCFHYDASAGRYSPVAMNIMRVGGLLTMLVLGSVILTFWIRDNRRKKFAAVGVQS